MSFTIRLPLLEIFANYISDPTDLLNTVKYLFQSFTFLQDVKIRDSVLEITLRYDHIFDAAADALGYDEIETMFPILSTDDQVGDDTRMFMFVTLAKYFDKYFGYDTCPTDHLTIYVRYRDLRKCLQSPSPGRFDKEVEEYFLSYGEITHERLADFLSNNL